jgi:hypothetical protein
MILSVVTRTQRLSLELFRPVEYQALHVCTHTVRSDRLMGNQGDLARRLQQSFWVSSLHRSGCGVAPVLQGDQSLSSQSPGLSDLCQVWAGAGGQGGDKKSENSYGKDGDSWHVHLRVVRSELCNDSELESKEQSNN